MWSFLTVWGVGSYNGEKAGVHHVWFAWDAGADRHFRDRSDYFWSAQAARVGPFSWQEPRGIQASLERAQEHARRGNPPGGTARQPGGLQGHRARGRVLDGVHG